MPKIVRGPMPLNPPDARLGVGRDGKSYVEGSTYTWADLTYVLPATSLGYVLVALLSHWLLGEHITVTRWLENRPSTAGCDPIGTGLAMSCDAPMNRNAVPRIAAWPIAANAAPK